MIRNPADRPVKRSSRLIKGLIILAIMAALALGGGSWLAGHYAVNKALEALNLKDNLVELKTGLTLALPLLNRAWVRDLSVTVRGEEGLVTASLGKLNLSPGPDKSWRMDIGGLALDRPSRLTTVDRLSVLAAFERSQRHLLLRNGNLTGLSRRSREAAAFSIEMDELTFEKISLITANSRRPLDWDLDLADIKAGDIRPTAQLANKDLSLPVFKTALSARNTAGDWSLNLELSRDGAPPPAAPAGNSGKLANLLSKALDKVKDFENMLVPDLLTLSVQGAWPDGGGTRPVESRSRVSFPGLFAMTVNGSSPALGKADLLAWVEVCRERQDQGETAGPCLAAVPFTELNLDYEDRGLGKHLAVAKIIHDQFLKDRAGVALSERLNVPMLGLTMALWLKAHEMEHAGGTFTFQADSVPMRPFSREFLVGVNSGRIKVQFQPK